MVEYLPSKQAVAGSSPVPRSEKSGWIRGLRAGLSRAGAFCSRIC